MRLAIDYGTVVTRAVLAWPDGRWVQLLLDGAVQLPSGVYVDADGALWAGQAALARGAADPAGFVAHPKQHLGQPHLQIRGRDLDVLELAAATLRRVAEQAAQLAGQAVPELTLTVPATWGPARRTALRRAATRAGLPQPHLVDTPVAAAGHLLATGAVVPAGAPILLCDLGAGRFEATVATRTPAGFEVLSTIDTTHAAGLALDTAVADHLATITTQLTPTQPTTPAADGVPVAVETPAMDGRAAGLDRAHAAIQALAGHPAVAVPADTAGMPVVLDRPTLDRLTHPALAQAVQTAQAAITAADLTPQALAGVYLYGDGIPPPLALHALADSLPTATVVADPDTAAVRGAAATHGPPAAPPVPPTPAGTPGIRHYAAVLLPAAASLLLLTQATTTAYRVLVPDSLNQALFVKANWGEYGLAGLLAVHAAVATALLATAHLARALHRADPDTPPPVHRLLARFLPTGAAIGLSIAALYAAIGALWHDVPNGPFLTATLLTATPTAALIAAIGLLATRRPHPPAASWLDWLTIPPLATAGAAAGTYLIQYSHTAATAAEQSLHATAGYLGAALFGIAAAHALPIPAPYQILTAIPLALTAAILVTGNATTTLAALYTLTTTTRLLTRATQLALASNSTPTPPAATPVDNQPTRR